MPTDKRQRLLLWTMLAAAASAALIAQGRVAAQEAPDDAQRAQGEERARSAEPAVGGLAGNSARIGANVLARADLLPTEGHTGHGTVTFELAPNRDAVIVNVSLFGLEPGEHGFHVHENGSCEGPKAEGAGDHFNPTGAPHGAPDSPAGQHHLGDLGNLTADGEGVIEDMLESRALLRNGELAVVGRAIVLHSGADDLESQPSGESGDPAACGVIRVGGEAITLEQGADGAGETPQVRTRSQRQRGRPAG